MGVQVPPFAMGKKLTAIFLILAAPLLAIKINPSATGFDDHKKRHYVDSYDFSGLFPHLENIDIDAHKKKCVEVDMSGEYPLLRSFCFDGSFGTFDGMLTGSFPLLSELEFSVTDNNMKIDLRGDWQKDCDITLVGRDAEVVIKLPKGVGLDIRTKTATRGKVVAEGLKKKGFGFNKKRFLVHPEAEITLHLDLQIANGRIILQ